MEIVLGLAGSLFIIFIINSFLSLEKELKKLNGTNEMIVELLKEIKKEQSK
ncbi:hypothetical protein V7201_19775 [Bacillus sp. JJ1122]|uniref:hypothetical protein n=1 Tax=Bacillus sp. JJ1122 TaxID=3122951 RepID=UPI0030005D66